MVAETATRTDDLSTGHQRSASQIAMREDPTVVLMGEDIAGGAMVDHLVNDDAWGGPMGVTKGLVQEFGRNRVLDTPITEAGFHRRRGRGGRDRAATGRRADVRRLLRLLHGPDLRPGRQAPLYVRREGQVPSRHPHPDRSRRQRRRSAFRAATTRSLRTCPASSVSCHRRRPTPKGCFSARFATMIS